MLLLQQIILQITGTIVVYLLSVSRTVCKLQIKTLKVSILSFDSPQRFVQWRISFYGSSMLHLLLQFFRTQKFADAFAFYYTMRDGTGLFSHYLMKIGFVKSCRN